MNDEFDSTVDTSFDDTSSDVTDSSIGTDGGDVGSYLDDTVDASEYADDFFEDSVDVESLMSDVADTDTITTIDSVADADVSDVVPLGDGIASDSTSDIDALLADTGEAESGLDTAGELTGEYDDSSSDVAALMDDTSDVSTLMDDLTDLGGDAQSLSGEHSEAETDITSLMDDSADADVYQATPNSDIQIVQEDGSVDTLENIMAANADTDADAPADVEPYQATPNSDIQIVQEDGSVDTLENIIAANADTDTDMPADVEPYQATPNSDIQIVQEDGSVDTLENIMAANADTDADAPADVAQPIEDLVTDGTDDTSSNIGGEVMADHADMEGTAYDQLMAYMSEHNYGRQHEAEYSQDPQWQELNNAYRLEQGLEPIDYGTQDWTDTHVDDVRAELVAMGIPEDSPELEAILQNEQRGIDEIRSGDTSPDVESLMDDTGDQGVADVQDGNEGNLAEPSADITTLLDDVDTSDETSDVTTDTGDEATDVGSLMDAPIHMTQSDVDWYIENANDPESLRQMQAGIASGRIVVDADTEIPTDATIEGVSDVPPEIDYDAVYSGLDSYDFDGVDVSTDMERLDSSLENFQSGTWENLSTDEQKAAMSDLADYVKDVIGFESPPDIVYYNNPVDGDYGGYSPGTNTLSVNEYMLYDNNEAADTIAHELWHAYQHERAMNPQSAKDYQYQYGFDNYIRPDDDFSAYQDQLVEAEARAFAQQFKDRLKAKGRGI